MNIYEGDYRIGFDSIKMNENSIAVVFKYLIPDHNGNFYQPNDSNGENAISYMLFSFIHDEEEMIFRITMMDLINIYIY